MSHLGARVAALVDGQLPAAETELLLAHAAGCGYCARLLEQERISRSMLSGARDIEPDPELTARLLALAPEPEQARPGRRRGVLIGAGVGAVLGATVVGLVGVGSTAEPRTDPHLILEAVSGRAGERPPELPAGLGTSEANGEIVAWLTAEGWSAPTSLPHGTRVVDVVVHDTADGEVLEMEIAGAMAHVRVLQQRGILAPESTPDVQAELVGEHDALPMPTGVHDVALQSEDCVVVVLAAADDVPVSEAILDALPAGDYDTSVGARLARGWQTVADWARG